MKAQEVRKRVVSSMASASAAIRWVRLSSPVSGSCRDNFRSCSSRAWRSLLMRTMPCARNGLPSGPANQQPVSSIQITGAEAAARTPYSIRYGTPSPLRAGGACDSASVRTEREGSISFANSLPLASASGGISANTAAALSLQAMVSPAMSQTKGRLAERGQNVLRLRHSLHRVASFRHSDHGDSHLNDSGPPALDPRES